MLYTLDNRTLVLHMPEHHMSNFFISNFLQKISAHYIHIYFNLLDILTTQTHIRVFVNKVVRKVSGRERKEVILGSRILHYECMRRDFSQ